MSCSCGHFKMQGTLEKIKFLVCQGIATADFHIASRRDALTCPIALRLQCWGKFSFLSLEVLPSGWRRKILCELKIMVSTFWCCSTAMSLMTENSRESYWDVSLILDSFISLQSHLPFVFPVRAKDTAYYPATLWTLHMLHTLAVCASNLGSKYCLLSLLIILILHPFSVSVRPMVFL